MNLLFRRRNYKEKRDQDTLLRNGAIFLEKLITSCDGKYNPIRSFLAEELKMATNNYDEDKVIVKHGDYTLYKCFLQKRPISVMKFEEGANDFCYNNIVFASQINHKNVLKLIGCCLETKIPILVFESVEYNTLAGHLYGSHHPPFKAFSWTNRLKIAMEIANAIAYLHIGLSRPVVFSNFTTSNILFDEDYVAKLFDFSFSQSIPEGETHIENAIVGGSYGYIAPEYFGTGNLNEKCDIYSFGGLLFVLLTGQDIVLSNVNENGDSYLLLDCVKKYNEDNRLNEIIDPTIDKDELFIKREQQFHSFTKLALKCVSKAVEERPTMIDVAKQLRQLYRSSM